MPLKKLVSCLLLVGAALLVSLPGHAAMVSTAELQSSQVVVDLSTMAHKREWIEQQLVVGGVDAADAATRVAALTDVQVLNIHKRIEEHPAGGNATLIIIFLLLVIAEMAGIIDVVPDWP